MEPIQRIVFLALGIGFFLLEGWERPMQVDEVVGIVLGCVVIGYALFYPRYYSPFFLKFNERGIHGKLAAEQKVRWPWNGIRQIRYVPIKLIVITDHERQEIALEHVDYKYRERILSRLMEVADHHHVETVLE